MTRAEHHALVNAIRGVLRLGPLYDRGQELQCERFLVAEVSLAYESAWDPALHQARLARSFSTRDEAWSYGVERSASKRSFSKIRSRRSD